MKNSCPAWDSNPGPSAYEAQLEEDMTVSNSKSITSQIFRLHQRFLLYFVWVLYTFRM